jgi:hypothetical protein
MPVYTCITTDINVLIIVGLRAGSVHRVLAKVAADGAADEITLNSFDSVSDLPWYSETLEKHRMPSSVEAPLREAIKKLTCEVHAGTTRPRPSTTANGSREIR